MNGVKGRLDFVSLASRSISSSMKPSIDKRTPAEIAAVVESRKFKLCEMLREEAVKTPVEVVLQICDKQGGGSVSGQDSRAITEEAAPR